MKRSKAKLPKSKKPSPKATVAKQAQTSGMKRHAASEYVQNGGDHLNILVSQNNIDPHDQMPPWGFAQDSIVSGTPAAATSDSLIGQNSTVTKQEATPRMEYFAVIVAFVLGFVLRGMM